MEQNIRKSKPYFFNLTKVNNGFAGGKELAVLNYARTLFYDTRHDKCTYHGEILGVSVECDGTKTPEQILSEVKKRHESMRQDFIRSPYGKWLIDFENAFKNLGGKALTNAIQGTVKTGTMLPLIKWYKEAMQTQTVINGFLEKHQNGLKYAEVLFDLTLNTKNIALILKGNNFPDEKTVYEELRDRGQIPERELAEKFIGACLYQMPIANKARYNALINSYKDGLGKQDKMTPSLWLINLSERPTVPIPNVSHNVQEIVKTHSIGERLFPQRGKNPLREK